MTKYLCLALLVCYTALSSAASLPQTMRTEDGLVFGEIYYMQET